MSGLGRLKCVESGKLSILDIYVEEGGELPKTLFTAINVQQRWLAKYLPGEIYSIDSFVNVIARGKDKFIKLLVQDRNSHLL